MISCKTSSLEMNFNDDIRSLTKNLHLSIEQMKMPIKLSDSIKIKSLNSQLDILHEFFLSCSSEDFSGPKIASKMSRQNSCFICQKNVFKQGPAIHCDYCSLIYHIHCLKRKYSSFILTTKKWMCPNHLIKNRHLANENRVKISQRTARLSSNILRQDFQKNKIVKTILNQQYQSIEISQIPVTIRDLYSKTIVKKQISKSLKIKHKNNNNDSIVRDILQSLVDCISQNSLETIEYLIEKLNQPDLSVPLISIDPISISYSNLIDLLQFHQSHAALIHLRSKKVLYIRKHVIWFGSSSTNDISLDDFHFCSYVTDRHACLYYDKKCHRFELLNYSEYGIFVNKFSYGFSSISNDQHCSSVEKCFCSKNVLSHTSISWDGPAMIDQGTVIQIGCHEFLFYRHFVR